MALMISFVLIYCYTVSMRMLDLFCGTMAVGKAFAARGWEVVGVDLVRPAVVPEGCTFIEGDVLDWRAWDLAKFDFVWASSPCEQFSVHGMKHFHPNPPYPELGLRLFNHTRAICEASGVPYVMENVRTAQAFVGSAVHHMGAFYLWGSAVPPLLPKAGIVSKGIDVGSSKLIKTMGKEEKRAYRAQFIWNQAWSSSSKRKRDTAKAASIPPELCACVADYAERICTP